MRFRNIERLVLIRHGQSKKNIEETGPFYKNNAQRERVGIFQDRLIPLTPNGLKQAKKVGKALKKLFGVPEKLFHSGYVRTKQTTGGILGAYSDTELQRIKVKENHLIRERNPGYLWNFTEAEVQEVFPWWGTHWYYADPFVTVPIGGESIASMCEGRLSLFFRNLDEEFSDSCDGGTVFLVSHGRAILGMRYLLENWNYDQMCGALKNGNPPNCSVTYYSFDSSGNPRLEFANKVFR